MKQNNVNFIVSEVLSTGTKRHKAHITACRIMNNGEVLKRSPKYLGTNWQHITAGQGHNYVTYKYNNKNFTKSGWAKELGISPAQITRGVKVYGSMEKTIEFYLNRGDRKTMYTGDTFVSQNGNIIKSGDKYLMRDWPKYCGINYNTLMARKLRLKGMYGEQKAFNIAITKPIAKCGRKRSWNVG